MSVRVLSRTGVLLKTDILYYAQKEVFNEKLCTFHDGNLLHVIKSVISIDRQDFLTYLFEKHTTIQQNTIYSVYRFI